MRRPAPPRRWPILFTGALLLLALALWLAPSREETRPPSASSPAARSLDSARPAASWMAGLLALPLSSPRGALSLQGTVLGPEGPLPGIVVIATSPRLDAALVQQPCLCEDSRTQELLEGLEAGTFTLWAQSKRSGRYT